MLNASEASLLCRESLKNKEDVRLEQLLKETENDIREVCSVGGNSVAIPVGKRFQARLTEALNVYGYKVLPADPDIEGEHIIVTWG